MQSWRSILPLSGSSSFWYEKGVDAWNSKRNGEKGFLKQTCGTNLLSAMRHILRTSEHRQLKGWQPHFQPTEAKSLVCSSHTGAQSVSGILKQILHATTPWPTRLLLCMRLVFFCSCKAGMGMIRPYCRAGGAFRSQEAQASGTSREWMLLIPRKNGGNGFLEQTCTTQQISVRQCITFCKHGQLKGWPPRLQPRDAKSSISPMVC